MIDALDEAPRLIVEATLEPVAGSTFQPTGFPDLGAATFERPGKPLSLLVESVQSMTNHLESLGWDGPAHHPKSPLSSLPYVEVVAQDGGHFLTSSRLEPHRLAAAYVRDGSIDRTGGAEWIADCLKLASGKPLDWSGIYRAILELDPLCLIHGVFFSDKRWHGNPRIRRAVTATIEAHGVAEVVSGGLKRDDVQITKSEGATAKEGYGFVPFARTEYAADSITLTAVVDLEQIRGYGLDAAPTRLLTLIALWELAELLGKPLRLRTACDFDVVAPVRVKRPDQFSLPTPDELAAAIADTPVAFEQSGARTLTWQPPKASAKKAA
jgi:CRISPR-associated protein Csb1